MTRPTLAEVGWTEFVREALEDALDRATKVLADMHMLCICSAADCGMTFDGRDKRAGRFDIDGITYHYCPACEIMAQQQSGGEAPPNIYTGSPAE